MQIFAQIFPPKYCEKIGRNFFQPKFRFSLQCNAMHFRQSKVMQWCFGAKYQFLFEMVQRGPDGPKGVPNGPKGVLNGKKTLRLKTLGPFRPLWATLERRQACHVWPFLGHPQSWTVDLRVKKRLITTSPICGPLVEPQNILFGTERWSFLPLSCHEWQVMGPKEIFYSYLVPEMIW